MGLIRKFFNQTRKPEGFLGKLMLKGMSLGHASVADWAMSLLNIPEPLQIAELGCGNGRDAGELLKKYPASKVTAVDYSPLSVEKTKIKNKNMLASGRLEVLENDVSNLKLEHEKFDLATAFETIYFWPGLEKCFENVRKILKPKGHFMIVMESNGQDKVIQWFKKRIDGMNVYSAQEINDYLKSACFSKIETHQKPSFGSVWLMVLAEK